MMLSACPEAEAQIVFENLTPKSTVDERTNIAPKNIPMAPMERMQAPSKPSAPMPGFQQNVIAPRPIMKSPIQFSNMRSNSIRTNMNKITFTPMVKDYIKPQPIHMDYMVRTIEPGKKMALPPPIEPAHWAFNPTLRGDQQAEIRYDTSIRTPMKDYNSPYHKDIPLHPMAW
jgi:hypothetical protein